MKQVLVWFTLSTLAFACSSNTALEKDAGAHDVGAVDLAGDQGAADLASDLALEGGPRPWYQDFIGGDPGAPLDPACATSRSCIEEAIAEALVQQDIPRVWYLAQGFLLPLFGDKAGIPEDLEEMKKATHPLSLVVPSKAQLESFFTQRWALVSALFEADGSFTDQRLRPLRDYIKYANDLFQYVQGDIPDKEQVSALLTKIADHLAQPAMRNALGCYSAPDVRDTCQNWGTSPGDCLANCPGWQTHTAFASQTAYCTILASQTHDLQEDDFVGGWQLRDARGGLQFDNGLVLGFLAQMYKATGQQAYLDAATDAATWIEEHVVSVGNWNYNSFSAYGLAHLYGATQDRRWLDLALRIFKLAVFPGIIPEGHFDDWRDGRWMDSHNAKNVYHWIIARGAITLLGVLPQADEAYPLMQSLTQLAFTAGIAEVKEFGVFKTSPAMEISDNCRLTTCPADVVDVLTAVVMTALSQSAEGVTLGSYYRYRASL